MSIIGNMKKWAAQVKAALLDHAYLITLGAIALIVAASAMYTRSMEQQTQRQIQAAAEAAELRATPAPVATPLPTLAPLAVRPSLLAGGGRVWPVSGDVVRAHQPDSPVYWEALGGYQAHAGVDIAGEAEEAVRLVMDGVVESLALDPLWGWRVRVAQTDGTQALYAGLSSCGVTVGQAVTRGQEVGILLEVIPCEAELGPHLHLEYERGAQTADPMELLENARRD